MRRLVPALVVGAMFCALSGQAATPRATKEQMAKHAADAETLWGAPGTNYATLSSAFIRPGAMPRDELLNRLRPMLAKAETAQDKAALNYLMGETYYWGGLNEVRRTRNASALSGAGDQAVAAYLDAWDEIGKAGAGPDAVQLGHAISVQLNQLLATATFGSNLAANVKRQVVTRYIDSRDKAGQAAAGWTAAQQGKAFANLGILGRMAAAIPSAMPTNFTEVCAAMDLAMSAGATNDAVRFASRLEEAHAAQLASQPDWRRKVIAAYRACGDARADASLKALAATWPMGWIDLYIDSVRRDPGLPQEQRREYMKALIQGLAKHDASICQSVYRGAAEALLAHGDHELAIWLAETAIGDSRFAYSGRADGAMIWRAKAMAHQKRGERDAALQAYEKAKSLAEISGYTTLYGSIRKEADALRQQDVPRKETKDESDVSKRDR